jgi:hypothetical protein
MINRQRPRPQPRPKTTNTFKTPPKLTNSNLLLKYIEVDLWGWLRMLAVNLLKINFRDNFQGFYAEDVLIPAATEKSIANQFKNIYPGGIPSGRIITRQKGDALIIDGNTPWTEQFVYLTNTSPVSDALITVFFFK